MNLSLIKNLAVICALYLLSTSISAQNIVLVCAGQTEEVSLGSKSFKGESRTYRFINGKLDGVYKFYFFDDHIAMDGGDIENTRHPFKTLWGISIDRMAGTVREIWVSKDQNYINEFLGSCKTVDRPKF